MLKVQVNGIRIHRGRNIKSRVLSVLLFLFFIVPDTRPEVQVRLKDEYVYIKVDEDFTAHVEVVFVFENTKGYSGTLAFPGSDWFKYSNFTSTWNDKSLNTEFQYAKHGQYYEINKDRYSSIITFKIPLTESHTSKHVIRYSYTAPYVKFEKDYESEGRYIEYILRTGALWKGKVSSLHVRVETNSPMACCRIKYLSNSFKGKCTSGYVWELDLKDIDLNNDIRLLYQIN